MIKIFVTFLFVFSSTILFTTTGNTVNTEDIENRLIATAKELNMQLPLMIDEETRLDAVLFSSKTFTYKGTLVNYHSSNLTKESTDIIHNLLYEQLNNHTCNIYEAKIAIDIGYKYSYLYFSNDGILITRIIIDNYQCP